METAPASLPAEAVPNATGLTSARGVYHPPGRGSSPADQNPWVPQRSRGSVQPGMSRFVAL